MRDNNKNCITFNGEIYNFLELREELGVENFRTKSDTEVILKAYERWGEDCLKKIRGMFAFALWDDNKKSLFCARDEFGIKPFYYMIVDNKFYFSSEIKAILPFAKSVDTNLASLKEYLAFQFVLGKKTLFENIFQLEPATCLTIRDSKIKIRKYWEIYYNLDLEHNEKYFEKKLNSLLKESVKLHTRSDVPIGGYLSGGLDSSAVCSLASKNNKDFMAFTGKFSDRGNYDESKFANLLAEKKGFDIKVLDINSSDFIENIGKVIYHLDSPCAGPGSFSQFMISKEASKYRKVLLGGQGGDEIFGGYTRYLIAYFEQCIKAAIEGTLYSGNFVVTYESIIPNLTSLENYKPLLQKSWSKGLFDSLDKRYFSLINRSSFLKGEINWKDLGDHSVYDSYRQIFYGSNVNKKSYFDLMTNFDFKTLLPALLKVEDRVSMANGIESRVPFLDVPYVEFAATIPSNIKFKNGNMKHIFKKSISQIIPKEIYSRKDKMGFPTPFSTWSKGPLGEFIMDIFSSQKAKERGFYDAEKILNNISSEREYSRGLWGMLSLEMWHQEFHDKQSAIKF